MKNITVYIIKMSTVETIRFFLSYDRILSKVECARMDGRLFAAAERRPLAAAERRPMAAAEQRLLAAAEQRLFATAEQRLFEAAEQRLLAAAEQSLLVAAEQRLFAMAVRRLQYRDSPTREETAVVVHEFSVDVGDCGVAHHPRAGLNNGLSQKRRTIGDNRRTIVTLPSLLSAVCTAQNLYLADSLLIV